MIQLQAKAIWNKLNMLSNSQLKPLTLVKLKPIYMFVQTHMNVAKLLSVPVPTLLLAHHAAAVLLTRLTWKA